MNLNPLKQTLLSLLPKLALVAGLSLGCFLLYQHLLLWYQGSAYSSVYAQGHLPRIERMALQKGEQEVSVPCVTVKAIQKISTEQTKPHGSPLSPAPLGVIAGQTPALQLDPLVPDYPLLLSRYIVKAPLLSDLVLESYLDKDGSNRILPAPQNLQPKRHLFEMGRQREVGLWIGAGMVGHTDLAYQSKLDLVVDVSYKQDLLRFAGVWIGLRAEAGYSQNAGLNGRIQIGIPVVRF